MKWARILTIIVGLACTFVALSPPPWLHALTIYVWGTMTSAFVAPLLYVLYLGDKMTPAAGAAGVFGGAAAAILWETPLARPGGVHPLLIGLLVSFVLTPLVAALTRGRKGK
jgi:Na+/pantothenate symporter